MANPLPVPEFQPAPEWLTPMVNRVASLEELPANWDSYGARSIDPISADAAISFLARMLTAGTPQPSIVPTPRGSIQFEWHCNQVDLEIDVISPLKVVVSFDDARTGESKELSLGRDWRPIQPFLARLTRNS